MNKLTIEKPIPFGALIPRRQCIPILYTRGTHYEVGFDMVIYHPINNIIFISVQLVRCFKKKTIAKTNRYMNE